MVQTQRRSKYTIDIQSGIHTLVSDVVQSLGGSDLGPYPHELLEAALAACTSITVQMYADRKTWPLDACNVKVNIVQENKDAIVIERQIELQGSSDDTQKKRLWEIAENCPIHEILVRGAKIETSVIGLKTK